MRGIRPARRVETAAVWFPRWRRQSADLVRLAAENASLKAELERLSDTAWELHENDERYRQLAEARERAEQASLAKSRVLATVSHEFRTPLNGILGLTGLLLETDLTPDQATYARAVHSSGEAMAALVDDMLDFSRIEAGRLDLRPAPASIEALLEETAELLAARAHAKGIDIVAAAARDVPLLVSVDAARLRQVLLNLAGNAVKFTEMGGVALSASRMEGDGENAKILFEVEDSGAGIAVAEVERLFGEFEQSDAALARRHGGVGLGLAISRRIVREMGGDIAVTGRDGGGSIFSFALDLPVVAETEPAALPLAGTSVLVVAPDGAEAPVLVGVLRSSGARARQVASANEAAALAAAAAAAGQAYDAVVLDARHGSLETALARIREGAGARLPAAVMIVPGQREEVEALRAAGFDSYLIRPVRWHSLTGVVGKLVAGGAGGFMADPGHAERPPAAPPRTGRALKVLLAEDNEINALLARAVLERLGHDVSAVEDGAAAVAAALAGRFDVILMDLHMPGLDGIAAAAAIRRQEAGSGRRTTILGLTADVLAETHAAATTAGIDAIVEKPMTPETLRRALAESLSRGSAAA